MKLTYAPSKDELVLIIHPIKGKANKKSGPFNLWWDNEGNIRAIAVTNYTKELSEFRKNLNLIQLGDIWKGVRITEDDIREAREALLEKVGEKW
jgi:hypothetical protein